MQLLSLISFVHATFFLLFLKFWVVAIHDNGQAYIGFLVKGKILLFPPLIQFVCNQRNITLRILRLSWDVNNWDLVRRARRKPNTRKWWERKKRKTVPCLKGPKSNRLSRKSENIILPYPMVKGFLKSPLMLRFDLEH